VRVNVPTRSQLVVDIDVVVVPSAAVILRILPQSMSTRARGLIISPVISRVINHGGLRQFLTGSY
jgi:hypothetical protein